jgi:5'-3' exonuclease
MESVGGFFNIILQEFPDIQQKSYRLKGRLTIAESNGTYLDVQPEIDHLYVDLYPIIINASSNLKKRYPTTELTSMENLKAPTVTNEDLRFISKRVNATLKKIYKDYSPKKTFHISMDGPSPLEKLNQQKNQILTNLTKTPNDPISWILPGTNFMEFIRNDVKRMAENLFNDKYYSKELQFYFSDCDEPGESKFKIFNHISNMTDGDKESYAILSQDKDFIWMLLTAKRDNIFALHGEFESKVDIYSKSKILQHFNELIPGKERKHFSTFNIIQMKLQ